MLIGFANWVQQSPLGRMQQLNAMKEQGNRVCICFSFVASTKEPAESSHPLVWFLQGKQLPNISSGLLGWEVALMQNRPSKRIVQCNRSASSSGSLSLQHHFLILTVTINCNICVPSHDLLEISSTTFPIICCQQFHLETIFSLLPLSKINHV